MPNDKMDTTAPQADGDDPTRQWVWAVGPNMAGDDVFLALPRPVYDYWEARQEVFSCDTWGELRDSLPTEIYDEVLGLTGHTTLAEYTQHLSVEGAVPLPNVEAEAAAAFDQVSDIPGDDEPFTASDDIPACADGDWPPSVFYLMDQELPEEVLDATADRYMTTFNGQYSEIPAAKRDEVLAALRAEGYVLTEEPGLLDLLPS